MENPGAKLWQDLFPGTVPLLGHFHIIYSLGSERHWNLKIKLCCKFLKQVIWCPDKYMSYEMLLSSNKLTYLSPHSYFGVGGKDQAFSQQSWVLYIINCTPQCYIPFIFQISDFVSFDPHVFIPPSFQPPLLTFFSLHFMFYILPPFFHVIIHI